MDPSLAVHIPLFLLQQVVGGVVEKRRQTQQEPRHRNEKVRGKNGGLLPAVHPLLQLCAFSFPFPFFFFFLLLLFLFSLFVCISQHGARSAKEFARREFSFTIQDDVYLRYKSFRSEKEFSDLAPEHS